MGGIYTGIFTPTEAAAMSAVYAFFVAVFVYKDMGLKDVPKVLLNSANMSAMLLYIITNAVLFSFIMTNENIPQALADWMLGKGFGPIAFLLAVNILLLLAGNFMEPSSIVLIFAPILFPVAMKLGIDPVHFGILMVVNMEVGMCHPPVGLNLYVASGITKMGITELTVAVWPWLLTHAGLPDAGDLLAGDVDLAAQGARHDVGFAASEKENGTEKNRAVLFSGTHTMRRTKAKATSQRNMCLPTTRRSSIDTYLVQYPPCTGRGRLACKASEFDSPGSKPQRGGK